MSSARNLVAVPFALARVPLAVIDRQLTKCLPAGSRRLAAFDTGLGSLDLWAGHLLRDDVIASHGYARLATVKPQRTELTGPHSAQLPAAPRRASTTTSYAHTRPATAK